VQFAADFGMLEAANRTGYCGDVTTVPLLIIF
jgi:hypothetical protein